MRLHLLLGYISAASIAITLSACDSAGTGIVDNPDDSCETVSGICPEYDPPQYEVNGLFETVVSTPRHASGHSLTVDDAGNYIVGGYQHLASITDVREYPVPVTLRFDRNGLFMDSTWHDDLGYGTISSVSSSGTDLSASIWFYSGIPYRLTDPTVAFIRWSPSTRPVNRLFERQIGQEFFFQPGLWLELPSHATGNTTYGQANTPLAIHTSDGGAILLAYRLTAEEQDVFRLDQHGEMSWSYQMPGDNRAQYVAEAPDGDLFIVGATDSILKYGIARLTPSGEELWYRTFDEGDARYLPITIAASEDALFVLGARKTASELVVIKHTLEGDIVWKKMVSNDNYLIPSGYYWETGNMIVTSSGKIVVVSSSDFPDERRFETRLIVLNQEGNIEESIQVSPSHERVHILSLMEYDTDRVALTGGVGLYDRYLSAHDFLLVAYQLRL